MENTVLVDTSALGVVEDSLVGTVLYGYRLARSKDKRVRIATAETRNDGSEIIVTRILIGSEMKIESGIYEAVQIDSRTEIHDILDRESNSGWLTGGRLYAAGRQKVVTLEANELIELNGSVLSIQGKKPSILF